MATYRPHDSVTPEPSSHGLSPEPVVKTPWRTTLLLFAAGCAVSLNIGKVPAALPAIAADLDLNLFQNGLIVALFSVLIAAFGLLIGLSAARMGYRRAALGGLLLAGAAGLSAPLINNFPVLLALRVAEGFGWVMVAVSMPVMMSASAAPQDRPLVLGIWGAFVPAGMVVALLYAPFLLSFAGWRGLWFFTGVLCLLAALLIFRPSDSLPVPPARRFNLSEIRAVVLRRITLAMAACFLVYSALYISITAFFPLVLIERHATGVSSAAMLGALIVIGNIFGNVVSGWLIARGVSRYLLLYVAMIACGVLAFGVFLPQIPIEWRVVSGALFTFSGGIIPGTLFASVPLVVTQVAHIGIVNGLIMQGAGNGQFFGPMLQTAIVERGEDWVWALLATSLFALAGLLAVRVFQKDGPSVEFEK